jgi:aminomethyltransferase
MTNCIWSPRLKANIGYALVSVEAEVGSIATVIRPNGPTEGQLVELPFL